MRRILMNGDAGCTTGFAKATHGVADHLHRVGNEVHVLAINHFGDVPGAWAGSGPDRFWKPKWPYPLYPCLYAGDAWGLNRLPSLLKDLRPDVLWIQNDPWNVADYIHRGHARVLPTVAWMPVDGKNCQGHALNGLALGAFYTQFALDEARKGGYTGHGSVIGLGVDRDVYKPMLQAKARATMLPPGKLPDGAFIVGNVNRNQPRKRLDLTIQYFAEWIRTRKVDDAYLYLHLAPTGDKGWDVRQLASSFGVSQRLIVAKDVQPGAGYPEGRMAVVYNCFDVQVNTGQGEGFGLTTLEGMACGVPQIVGDWSALGEWPEDAAVKVPCTSISTTPNNINIIGGIPDRAQFVEALDRMYRDRGWRADYAARAYEHASQDRFSWEYVGIQWARALDVVLDAGGMESAPIVAQAPLEAEDEQVAVPA